MITIERQRGDCRRIDFLPDYCPQCNPLGDQADRPVRLAALMEPTTVSWPGGRRVTCAYACSRCGHHWTRNDLWDAASAGFDRKDAA